MKDIASFIIIAIAIICLIMAFKPYKDIYNYNNSIVIDKDKYLLGYEIAVKTDSNYITIYPVSLQQYYLFNIGDTIK